MATPSEVRAFFRGQIEDHFNRSISGDLKIVGHGHGKIVDTDLKGQSLIRQKIDASGLRGEIIVFTADSRKNPIGLPIMQPGGEEPFKDTVAAYIPSPKDRDLMSGSKTNDEILAEIRRRTSSAMEHVYASAKAKKINVNMKGDVVVVGSDIWRHWEENGLLPLIPDREKSSFTADDKAKIRERNKRFLENLIIKTIEGMRVMGENGIRPRDMLDKGAAIRKIDGAGISVSLSSFTNPDYSSLRPIIHRRDDGKCLALNTSLLETMTTNDIAHLEELPVCRESTIDNYGWAIGPLFHSIIPGRNIAELNHVYTQGDTTVTIAKAIFANLIPPEIYTSPEKLLMFLSGVDLRSMVAQKVRLFEKAPTADLIRVFVPALQYAIQAVNSVGNLVSVSRNCHRGRETGGYHPDMHNGSLPKLMAAIDRGQDTIPMTKESFDSWCKERIRLVLDDKYPHPLKEEDDVIEKIRSARAIASAIVGIKYVDPEVQRVWSKMVGKRTSDFVHEELYIRTAEFRRRMSDYELREIKEEGITEVVKDILSMDTVLEKIKDEMHVKTTGITGNKLLNRLGLKPIDIKEKKIKTKKTKKKIAKKK